MTTTPDEMAAAPAPPTWKGADLPEVGRHVRVDHRVTDNGRTRWTTVTGIVGARRVEDDGALTIMVYGMDGKPKDSATGAVSLDPSYGLDKWAYTRNTNAEHEYRKATDPIYRHHADTLEYNMGMARLRAEEHARDFDNAVPAAVVETVEKYGVSLDELNPAQRAAYDSVRPPKPVTVAAQPAATATTAQPANPSDGDDVPDPDATDIPGMLRRLQWLKGRIDDLKADLKSTEGEYNRLNAETVREMASEGMTSSTINGYTAFFAPKQHVEKAGPDVTSEDVLDAIRRAGLGHMIKPGYSGQTLKSYLAELDRDGLPVPDALADVVVLKTDYEIRFRRAAAHKRRMPPSIGGGVSGDEPITLGSADS